MKKALITGITGQDGSYLAELLLDKGYSVHGVIRRSSSLNTKRIDHIFNDLVLFHGDLTDGTLINRIISKEKYDEIYNLAAQSHVKVSFDVPEYTGDVDGLGVTRLLESIRCFSPYSKFYQAGSSEMFGGVFDDFNPASPYACAKVYAHYMVKNYRDGYGLWACNGILFNHESPRRGETFVTRKITIATKKIKNGEQDSIHLGNLKAKRDWGYAPDYVRAMWLMLQNDEPEDFVIATGESHSVEEFLTIAFEHAGLDWNKYIVYDPQYIRPTEVNELKGDYSKAREKLGWNPTVRFDELVRLMVDAER